MLHVNAKKVVKKIMDVNKMFSIPSGKLGSTNELNFLGS